MKKQLFYLLLLIGVSSYAQNNLKGKIISAESGESLEQVSVYFPQLEKGATTDKEGVFSLSNLPTGQFKLVASYIGFQTYSATVTIVTGENTLNIELEPSAIEMQEVIVSTPFHKLQRENVMKVEQEKLTTLRANGAITLSDGISTVTGVETVSTGVGIGKPVIRGLSANRVLVYAQGIRLENQQFGDEHGLGISDAGIESVEVIKGPASLLYGSDALGGVLYLNPERYAINGSSGGDLNLNYFSNTGGISSNLGYKASGEKFKYLVRAGIASHTDYKAGNDLRVTNSRFREYDLKTGLGYQSDNFKTDIRYNYNKAELGIPEEIGEQSRERTPESPYQELHNHILSSTSDLFFEDSSLKLILGYIFNDRKEFEEGEEGAALDMNLSTFNYNLQYHLPKGEKLETIVGVQGMSQSNKNFGEEVLIPDATTNDVGILATSHVHLGKSDVQLGIRYDHRSISGEENGLPAEEGYIPAIERKFNSVNAAIGIRTDISKNLIGRLNVASGFRAPNLAELTSNGTHEGTNRFEVGNPGLKNERNVQFDLSLEYSNQHIEFFINGFHNTVNDFIYLEPNGTFFNLDPVYLYRQEDAKLYGGEMGFHFHPHPLDWLHVESTFEMVRGELATDEDLPLIPANSWVNTLRIENNTSSGLIRNSYAFLTLHTVFDQDRVSSFETPTPGYTLLNIGFGGAINFAGKLLDVRVSANNLLDKEYFAHLSRLKIDGIPNIGRNISIGMQYSF